MGRHRIMGGIADALSCLVLLPKGIEHMHAANGLQHLVPLLECQTYVAHAAAACLAILFKVDQRSRDMALRLGAKELLLKMRDRCETSDTDLHMATAVANFL